MRLTAPVRSLIFLISRDVYISLRGISELIHNAIIIQIKRTTISYVSGSFLLEIPCFAALLQWRGGSM